MSQNLNATTEEHNQLEIEIKWHTYFTQAKDKMNNITKRNKKQQRNQQ
jgi:hypothetical protein